MGYFDEKVKPLYEKLSQHPITRNLLGYNSSFSKHIGLELLPMLTLQLIDLCNILFDKIILLETVSTESQKNREDDIFLQSFEGGLTIGRKEMKSNNSNVSGSNKLDSSL